MRTIGLGECQESEGQDLNPPSVGEFLRHLPKCHKISTDDGSVLSKEETQAERWHCISLPICNRSRVGGKGVGEPGGNQENLEFRIY